MVAFDHPDSKECLRKECFGNKLNGGSYYCIGLILLFSFLCLVQVQSVLAEEHGCYGFQPNNNCGANSVNSPVRCYPMVTSLEPRLERMWDSANSRFATFCINVAGTGFQQGNEKFQIAVSYTVGHGFTTQSVGSCIWKDLSTANSCVECSRECIYLTKVIPAPPHNIVKFWAEAQQWGISVPTCACETDTIFITVPTSGSVSDTMPEPLPLPVERGPIACQATIGDPINLSNGNMYFERLDVPVWSDKGASIAFGRFYNSYTDDSSSSLWKNWRHSFEYSLSYDTTSGNYTLLEPTGRSVQFTKHLLNSSEPQVVNYTSPYGTHYRIRVAQPNDSITIVLEDDTKLFIQGLGKIDSLQDLAGNKMRFYYTTGLLDSTVNSSGRRLSFSYSSGRMTCVRSFANDTLAKFEYYPTVNLLKKVTYPDASWEEYTYDTIAANNRKITSISSSNSFTRRYTYDSSGRANQYTRGNGYDRSTMSWSVTQTTCPDSITTEASSPTGTRRHTSFWSPAYSRRDVTVRADSSCAQCGVKYEYNAGGLIEAVADANGVIDSALYDHRGNRLYAVAGGNTSLAQRTYFTFDSSFNRPTRVMIPSIAKSNDSTKLKYTYDALGNVTQMIERGYRTSTASDSFSYTSTFTYNASGQMTKSDGPRTDVVDTVKFVYHGNGDLRYEIQPNTDTTEFGERDILGRRTWVKTSSGDTTKYTFDSRGRLTKVKTIAATSDSVVFSYDVDGKLLSTTSPTGNASTFRYSAAGYLDSVKNALGEYMAYTYDSVGNPLTEKIYKNSSTLRKQESFTYNNKSELTKRTGLYGDSAKFTYSAVGMLESLKDGLDKNTRFKYDSLRRVIEQVQPLGSDSIVTKYFYDTRNNITKVTDPGTNNYVYRYDDKNRLIFDSSIITGVTRYGYDPADNLIWKKNALNDSIVYKYDALNRLTKICYPDSSTNGNIIYVYDGTQFSYGKGRLYSDSTKSCRTRYRYDAKGRLYQELRVFPNDTSTIYTTTYGYDKNDNLTKLTYPSGRVVEYTYDAADQVTKIRDSISGSWKTLVDTIKYTPFGRPESWRLGNGVKVNVGVDSSYRVDSIATASPDTSLFRFGYSYTLANNISQVTDRRVSNNTKSYTYDDIYRLTRVISLDAPDDTITYSYHKNGNRDKVIEYGSPRDTLIYQYSGNKVTNITDIALAFTYDATGNVTREIEGIANETPPPFEGLMAMGPEGPQIDTILYAYNDAGRLITITGDGTTITMGYDAWHRRIKKSYGGAHIYFIPALDGQQADYVYLNGTAIARLGNSSQGNREYYITDQLGTPHVLADSAKTVRWKSRSYPFGVIYNEVTSTTNYVRFPGQWKDSESRLTYNWHRYYNPRIGRYYQADPINLLGGINLYAYVDNNPVMGFDLLGLKNFSCEETEKIIAEAGIQSLWDAFFNHIGNERYDFKANQKFDTFNVGGVVMKADEFGNYLAGYVGVKAGGVGGELGVRLGGIFYDFWDDFTQRRGRDFLDVRKSTFDFDSDSWDRINAGRNRALNEANGHEVCGCP